MQAPYQEASDAIIRQQDAPGKAIKKGVLAAGTLAATGTRLLPWVSSFIPEDLMKKGLTKIDPRMGKFFQGAENAGYGLDEARDFLTKKLAPEQEEEQQTELSNPAVVQDLLEKALELHKQTGKVTGRSFQKYLADKHKKAISYPDSNDIVNLMLEQLMNGLKGQSKAALQPQPQPQQQQQQQQQQQGQGSQALLQAIQQLKQTMGGK